MAYSNVTPPLPGQCAKRCPDCGRLNELHILVCACGHGFRTVYCAPPPHPARPPDVTNTDLGQMVIGCLAVPFFAVIALLLLALLAAIFGRH